MTPRSFLITGASGFVGHHMAAALLAQGHRVAALDLKVDPNLPEGVEPWPVDLRNPTSLEALPRRWDGVIHLAGASIPSQFTTPAPVLLNLEITLNLLNHLRDSRVLLVSSCHVYASAPTPRKESDPLRPQGLYGLSKHLMEQMEPHFEGRLDLRVARPFNHLGPGLRPELMLPSLMARLAGLAPEDDAPVLMKGLNSTRDFIDVRDVVRAYLAILDLDSPAQRTFNVCTGRATSIEEVVRTLMTLQGRMREIRFLGSPNSADDLAYLVGDPARLTQATGWSPRHSLSDSLESMLQQL
jgi:GDP-4-dehydro-6-deoxy-D-mannose reductase